MTIDVVNLEDGSVQRIPITLEGSAPYVLRLAVVPGADAVEVIIRDEEQVVSAIEIPALPGQEVRVEIRRDPTGMIQCTASNRQFFVLPDENPPKPAILVPTVANELDLAILVDGTCLYPTGAEIAVKTLEFLLSPAMAGEWGQISAQLAEFASVVSRKYPDVWITTLAFGDEPMPIVTNSLLKPAYLIHPANIDERQLKPTTVAQIASQITQRLSKLPFTPGGDFVDGLANGLRAAHDLLWRPNSRKLLLLFGQSPGYSFLTPADPLANLLTRSACVEEEIDLLHKKGIEVVSVFLDPAEAEERYSRKEPQPFLSHSRRQYESLATLPDWIGNFPGLDVKELASAWLNPPQSIARGASPGFLVKS